VEDGESAVPLRHGGRQTQTGIAPSRRPRCSGEGRPSLSNPCQASAPPRAQPVPSVHTSSILPAAFTARTGCLRPYLEEPYVPHPVVGHQ
jgi:hypothetical protein